MGCRHLPPFLDSRNIPINIKKSEEHHDYKTTGRMVLNTTLLAIALSAPLGHWRTSAHRKRQWSAQTITLSHWFTVLAGAAMKYSGWHHFGGFNDIQEILKAHGYLTVTPPLDRYPATGSGGRAVCPTDRWAGRLRCSPRAGTSPRTIWPVPYNQPLIPGLGQTIDNKHQKVNLIAHSQGSPTVRVLIELLANGSGRANRNGTG